MKVSVNYRYNYLFLINSYIFFNMILIKHIFFLKIFIFFLNLLNN